MCGRQAGQGADQGQRVSGRARSFLTVPERGRAVPGEPVGPCARPPTTPAIPLCLLDARVRWTSRADGDVRPWVAGGRRRLAAVAPRPVSWLRQVHGAGVVVVGDTGAIEGDEGDVLVTTSSRVALGIFTADCAPVALASPEGIVAAVHAGWGGLVAGVVQQAVSAMRDLGATRVEGALGPCIHAGCYEFREPELERVVEQLGPGVRSLTHAGSPALDLPAAVRSALAGAGAELTYDSGVCTACGPADCFSHRARGEPERQAMVVWRAA